MGPCCSSEAATELIKGISERASSSQKKTPSDLEKVLSARKADPGDIEAEIKCPVTPRNGRFESFYRYKKNDKGEPSEFWGKETRRTSSCSGSRVSARTSCQAYVLCNDATTTQFFSDLDRMLRCTRVSLSTEATAGSGWRSSS